MMEAGMKTVFFRILAAGWLGCLLPVVAWADAAHVRQLLDAKVPRLAPHVKTITAANVFNLYELYTDDRQILYTDENVNFFFAGDILDARTLQNLTQARMKVLGAVSISDLPLDLAMKKVKGNGKRQLVVFSDPDCPFCRKLEQELESITDVTIYTFILPIGSLHPDAPQRAHWIWCAPDRQKAWDDYLLHRVMPGKRECRDSLRDIQNLAARYRIDGTPTLIFADGEMVPGVIPRDDLEQALGKH